MNAVEQLKTLLTGLREAGWEIRYDWLGGAGGGPCQVRGQRILFLDLAQGPLEQLDQAAAAAQAEIRSAPRAAGVDVPRAA